jgi:uncharacterized membrane protein
MGNVGRFFCVALPFILTAGSLITLLVATLGGIANTNLYLFQVNLKQLSINPLDLPDIKSIVGARSVLADVETTISSASASFAKRSTVQWHDEALLAARQGQGNNEGRQASGAGSGADGNITAADLGLGDLYDVSLWGYCRTDQTGKRECTKAKFNWAQDTVNTTAQDIENFGSAAAGQQVNMPKQVQDAVQAFASITRWTEIAFIVALIALAVELIFGIFATCTRVLSCITFIVAGVASAAVIAAASLATAMAVVVVGSVESTARFYGVRSTFNTSFLTLVWLSAALALGASFFWLFTICCCKPEHRSSSKKSKHASSDAEKLLPTTAYQPLHEPEHNGYYNHNSAPQYGAPRYPSGAPRSDIAYEPYSHRA